MKAICLFLGVCFTVNIYSEESPTSYGSVAKIDTPILRVPMSATPPKIDGIMDEGEWENAGSLSGFWYDYAQAKFLFMAPVQTQLQLYASYDKENIYLAYNSPVYPEGSWLKARGRFPDVINHPLYGTLWDDHVELEMRPYHDNAKGFQLGLFKWVINPIATYADQCWTINHGEGKRWKSGAKIRCGVNDKRWIIECAVPLKEMAHLNYTGKDENGNPLVQLPPSDGTAYRVWFTRGIGGNGAFFNAFDNHIWNTTKTKFILDSKATSFQINELGPIMDDVIDLKMTVKNHHTQSQTVRIGFFVESEEGLIYSSYDAPELKDGLVELVPGEVKKLRIKKPFPGISIDGNALWFDVRSAGRPAKILFRTRLIRFHSMDGGAIKRGENGTWTFRERRLEVIKELRPPKEDFSFRYDLSTYRRVLAAVVDKGIHGASEEAKSATEFRLIVMKDNDDEDEVHEGRGEFIGDFATLELPIPDLVHGESYKLSLLLFDANKRIVGERNPEAFKFEIHNWQNNKIGLDDVVWEPYTPMVAGKSGFGTLKHEFTLDESGLPSQIFINPDSRELPLEKRIGPGLSDSELVGIGRGPQLRAPIRLSASIDGKQVESKVKRKAKLKREWKSELEYESRLELGDIDVDMVTQYDCDGAMQCNLHWEVKKATTISNFEIVFDLAGRTDMIITSANGGGMAGADIWECTLPDGEGVVWDSSKIEPPELYYSAFMPWVWIGSADRAFTFFSDTDEGWVLDQTSPVVIVERNKAGDATMRIRFINHESEVQGERDVQFTLLTHPSKSKPDDSRRLAWHYRGGMWADEFFHDHVAKSDEDLINKAKQVSRSIGGLDKNAPVEDVMKWTQPTPPYWRFYQLRHVPSPPKGQGTKEMDQAFQDKFVWAFEKHIRIGRRHGWWWDETWPVYRSNNVAEGNAYFRDPKVVKENELPWQAKFLTGHMRAMFKRLARAFKQNGVPNRNYLWANNSATCFESFAWDTMLVEECGAGHRTFEVDIMTQFPSSLYRYMSHNWTGLVARVTPDVIVAKSGDDARLDRQVLGRALLNDIGMCFDGPHGYFTHRNVGINVINALEDFGVYDMKTTEVIPFWRSEETVRFGAPDDKNYVTVYRRPLEGGGYKALIVLVNENDKPVDLPVEIVDPVRVLGGGNTLTAVEVHGNQNVPDELKDWWQSLGAPAAQKVLMDLETGEGIRQSGNGESYGPIHVGYHNFRILYAESKAQ